VVAVAGGVVVKPEQPIDAIVAAGVAEVVVVAEAVEVELELEEATRHPPPNAAAILARRVEHESVSVVVAEEVVDVVAVEAEVARVEVAGVARKTKRSQQVPRNSTRPWMSIG
jgi:hypothetical protein